MNQLMISTTSKQSTPAEPPVCRMVSLQTLPQFPENEMAYCAIPSADDPEVQTRAFLAAPQFKGIVPAALLKQKQSENLRVILLGSNDYYIRQAAAYLTAFAQQEDGCSDRCDTDDFWNDLDIDDYLPSNAQDKSSELAQSLAVLSTALLDPSLAAHSSRSTPHTVMLQIQEQEPKVDITMLRSAGLLLHAKTGPVLSATVLHQISAFLQRRDAQALFIAMRPEQMDQDLLEELHFTHGFQICRVGQADSDYLRRLLLQTADSLAIPVDPTVDIDTVISRLHRYRGNSFTETDIEQLLRRCVLKCGNTPLRTQDLNIQPYRFNDTQGRDALQSMIGLDGVKDTMSRLLASAVLDDRRRAKGIDTPPSCRNLAFSGNPGTGKSVTARLAAQILREEGCGSGKFVEAGREQLIGSFLGQTSPMIADLFRQAKGGVLFIDEAGALISDGRDSYATEAVNALVRHMELEPETMVIFATYPDEMKRLLASNPGLSSRIAHVLDFPDYEEDTLYKIFRTFAQKESLPLSRNASEICREFFRELRRRKGGNFGNGREARRLFQAAKEELALRTLNTPDAEHCISAADLRAAANHLLSQEQVKESAPIGFHG